ncbi:MAG: DUF456 domain-containing protein [Calditrichaeota bacterium]|nr:MAG: DUF456 domain-containing protein [Calditrichota bacterium]
MEAIISATLHFLFWLVLVVSVFIVPLGLPGTFVIVGTVLLHGFLTDFVPFSGTLIVLLLAIAILGEGIEFFFGAASAKKFGGSKQSMWGAILGGFAGAVVGTGIVPVVGTLIGVLVGAFIGAAGMEYLATQNSNTALRVGFGAFLGTLGGRFSKLTLAIIMVIIVVFRFIQ